MNWVFVDPLPWDYDVATPLVRPLGGSQSALCYLAQALARRGHTVTTLTATTHPRDVASVRCLNRNKVSAELLRREETVVVELNGPASIAKQYRPLLPRGVPLVLWTQIIPYHDNEVVMTAVREILLAECNGTKSYVYPTGIERRFTSDSVCHCRT